MTHTAMRRETDAAARASSRTGGLSPREVDLPWTNGRSQRRTCLSHEVVELESPHGPIISTGDAVVADQGYSLLACSLFESDHGRLACLTHGTRRYRHNDFDLACLLKAPVIS